MSNVTATSEIIIIGAGVMGCAAAYYLAKEGRKVLVLEKVEIGHGGSSRNGGGVRQVLTEAGNVYEGDQILVACGFSGHGFGLGPGVGKIMSELMTGKETCVDVSPLNYQRFVGSISRG